MAEDVIYGINGPVITLRNSKTFSMMEMVYVGDLRLIGEVISISDERTTIQCYEETTDLKPGEPVISTGSLMNVTLGPGILSNIFDGIERPLRRLEEESGAFIGRGMASDALDMEKKWAVTFTVSQGDEVHEGDVFATCPETESIEHRFMIPNGQSGRITKLSPDGAYTLAAPVGELTAADGSVRPLMLYQQWPIKRSRPVRQHLESNTPLVTGQRIVDTLFPIAKGGAAAIPGGFGTGKTMMQHQLAKWCDADIIIYVGCGERGNEMSQVLEEFSGLVDPKTGNSLMNRTTLIANTSNMPVAAREASIYTGITLAEYYRDMGYHVALMADSTSRWAEALREISGRLEEMPAEEGFPAYLPSRLAEFYERAGMVTALNGKNGSITVIGAVSPAGNDFSEPVTQNTKRYTRCFWALDKSLAYERHYPAVNWTESYSEYKTDLEDWYKQNLGLEFTLCRGKIAALLQEENSLMEIVRLVGEDVLPDEQKLILQTARVIRVGFLQQNAFHAEDSYVSLDKQEKMMHTILLLHRKAGELIAQSIPLSVILKTGLFDKLTKMKYDIPNNKPELFDEYAREIHMVLVPELGNA